MGVKGLSKKNIRTVHYCMQNFFSTFLAMNNPINERKQRKNMTVQELRFLTLLPSVHKAMQYCGSSSIQENYSFTVHTEMSRCHLP